MRIMAATVLDMIRAGALRQLCQYYDSLGHKPAFWGEVRQYAIREFRDIDHETINGLILECKKSVAIADELNKEH